MGSAWSPFWEYESYLRIVVSLDEDNIQVFLKQYNSYFITCELPPGIYTIKDVSEVVYNLGDHDGTTKVEFDEINIKTRIISNRFGRTIRTLRNNLKSFQYFIGIHTVLGLQTHYFILFW